MTSRIEQLLQLASLINEDDPRGEMRFPFAGPVAIRTVTHYYTGNVVRTDGGFVVLDSAAWIADTGRWSDFLAKGTANEVEPFPSEMAVSLGAIVDVAPWTCVLPCDTK